MDLWFGSYAKLKLTKLISGKSGTLKVDCFAMEIEENLELIRRRCMNEKWSSLSLVSPLIFPEFCKIGKMGF